MNPIIEKAGKMACLYLSNTVSGFDRQLVVIREALDKGTATPGDADQFVTLMQQAVKRTRKDLLDLLAILDVEIRPRLPVTEEEKFLPNPKPAVALNDETRAFVVEKLDEPYRLGYELLLQFMPLRELLEMDSRFPKGVIVPPLVGMNWSWKNLYFPRFGDITIKVLLNKLETLGLIHKRWVVATVPGRGEERYPLIGLNHFECEENIPIHMLDTDENFIAFINYIIQHDVTPPYVEQPTDPRRKTIHSRTSALSVRMKDMFGMQSIEHAELKVMELARNGHFSYKVVPKGVLISYPGVLSL